MIQELENNEALLLMYLADELPAEDRAEVDQMLASDPGLRAHLAGIKAAYNQAVGALETLDRDKSAEAGENHAIRQASRAMKQWQVDRLNRQTVVIPMPRIRVPVWAYPIGVAAMLVIGSLIWWGGQADTPPTASNKVASVVGPGAPSVNIPPANPTVFVSQGLVMADDSAKAKLLENSLNEVPAGISDAETQANSLVARSDNASVASSIYLSDGNP